MDYNEAKSKVDGLSREIMVKQREKVSIEEEVTRLQSNLSNLEMSTNNEINEAKKEALVAYRDAKCLPIMERGASLEKEIESLKEQETEKIERAKAKAELEKKKSMETGVIDEVKKSMVLLDSKIDAVIGDRFSKAFTSQLDSVVVEIDTERLDELVVKYRQYNKEVSNITSNTRAIIDSLFIFLDRVFSTNFNTLGKYAIPTMLGILVLVLFLGYRYVFPIYIVLITVVGVYNVISNYKLRKTVIIQKVVKDNIESINKYFEDKVKNQLDNALAKIQTIYEKKRSAISEEIKKLESDYQREFVNATNTFKFNEKDYLNGYEERKSQLNNLLEVSNANLKVLVTELSELQTERNKAHAILSELAGSIQEKYLNINSIGNERVFPGIFLMDIVNSKPVFFTHPRKSCLILYDKNEDIIYDFIRLLCLELRISMHPNSFNVTIYDPIKLCEKFVNFKQEVDEKLKSIEERAMKLLTKSTELVSYVDSLDSILSNRLKIMTKELERDDDDINVYNKKMLDLESVPESYEFNFIISPSSQILNKVETKGVIGNGGRFGIYTHLFCEVTDFYNSPKESIVLTDKVHSIFEFVNGELKSRAKEYVLENRIKPQK